jgi:O-antigen/teichoic acid export membrane protein
MTDLRAESQISSEEVKKRSVQGVMTLVLRTLFIQLISFAGFFFLTVLLGKEEIGLFFAVSELVAILGYFSDVGLAAALIQKKEEPTIRETRSTFAVQQALVIILVVLVFILTPWLSRFYSINRQGIFLLWSLTIGFFLASLKTIPSVLLERKIRFDLLAMVEICETMAFYLVSVFFAWKGFGVLAYALAVLARGFIGVFLIYLLSPWKIGFAFEKKAIFSLLRFGFPYQTNSFLAVVKDRLMNIFLWKIIGSSGVGILGWSQKWSQMPLRLLIDNVSKVTFPAYSRLQEDKNELQSAIEKSLFFITLVGFPIFTGMAILARPLILVIPNYQKWEVALFSFYLFSFNAAWASFIAPLINALNAIGKVKTTLQIMVLLTVLTWLLTPPFAISYGYNGVAIVSALMSLTGFLVVWVVKKVIPVSVVQSILKPLIFSLLMGSFIVLLLAIRSDLPGIAVIVGLSIIFYLYLCFFGAKKEIAPLFKKFFPLNFSQIESKVRRR